MATVNETVTAMFIERIEARRAAGEKVVAPWRKPWNAAIGADRNIVTDKPYRGSNVWITAIQGFSSPLWGTFKQWKALGGTVKRDANDKALPYTPITFWIFPDEEGKNKGKKPSYRFYRIYNSEQIEGVEALVAERLQVAEKPQIDPVAAAQAIVSRWTSGPSIGHGGGRACYNPSGDKISMPDMQAFESAGAYYHTLFHEMTHASGHRKRLAREGVVNIARFGSHSYSSEELIAEMGAAMLGNACGIMTPHEEENSAAYLDGWLKKLKAEPNWLAESGGAAQKAFDHIQGISWGK